MPFLNKLKVEKIDNDRWKLVANLKYQTHDGELIIVPKGFITNFASVPRIPLAFLLAGDVADAPSVIHDYLYSRKVAATHYYTRADADRIFREAMEDDGIWLWRRWLMWTGVRIGGCFCYRKC